MPCAGALVAKQRVGDTPTWLARQRGGAHRLDAHDAGAERELSVSRAALQLMDEVALLPVCAQPLRDRKEDVPQLVKRFLVDVQGEGQSGRVRVSPDAMEKIVAYSWPGNVRELENTIERAVVLSKNDIIDVVDLPK